MVTTASCNAVLSTDRVTVNIYSNPVTILYMVNKLNGQLIYHTH